MPEQKFTDTAGGADLVVVSWDMGMRAVDVAFGGTLLTQITNLEQLRTSGMQGPAPDGSQLLVRMVKGPTGDVFTVERNGLALEGGHINFAAPGPRIGEVTMAGVRHAAPNPAGLGLDHYGRLMVQGQRVDDRALGGAVAAAAVRSEREAAMDRGRKWLLVNAVLNTIGVVLAGLIVLLMATLMSKVSDSFDEVSITTSAGTPADPAAVKAAMSIMAVVLFVMVGLWVLFTVGWWVLWAMSKGRSAALAFGIARVIAALYVLGGLLQLVGSLSSGKVAQGLGSVLLGLVLNGLALRHYHAARKAALQPA